MKRLLYIALLLAVACTQAYPDIDNPNHSSTAEDRKIIDYIDQRLIEEYYWQRKRAILTATLGGKSISMPR